LEKGKMTLGKLISGKRYRNITILLYVNAAGDQLIPSLCIYRGKDDNKPKKNPPKGSLFDVLENGWITSIGFLKRMKENISCVHPPLF
jgi:hypothetical protein